VALAGIPPGAARADRAFTIAAWMLGLAGLLLPLGIVGHLFADGAERLSWTFLTMPPQGFPLGSAGGIGPAIAGSLALVGIGLALAVPLGVAGAVALSEYVPEGRWARAARFSAECLAGVPAIIYGLFGYALLVVTFRFGLSLLAGGMTLGLMMMPIILVGAHTALTAVERDQREAAAALGVSRLYAVRRIFLPRALPGILAATVLAAGHAIGSAAPVMFTAGIAFSRGGLALDAPVMTLPTHLYYVVSEGRNLDQAYGTALVLVLGLLFSNASALLVRRWLARR
jgi:phosphate transport system permease protein